MLQKNLKDIIINKHKDKLINNNFYLQSLIRQTRPVEKNKILTTDDYNNLQKKIGFKNYNTGDSINTQKRILLNNFNSNFKIQTSLGTKNTIAPFFLEKYKSNLTFLGTNKSKPKLITITRSIKGGAQGIISGTTGFIPKSHYYNSIKNLLTSKSKKLNVLSNFKKLSKFITPKILLEEVNFTLYPNIKYNQFTSNKNIKKSYAKNNIVFTQNKKNIKDYETKKKVRKYKNDLLPKRKKSILNKKNRLYKKH